MPLPTETKPAPTGAPQKPEDLPLADEAFDPTALPGIGDALKRTQSAEIPGFYTSTKQLSTGEEYAPLRANVRSLTKLGLGMLVGKDDRMVFFNPQVLKIDEVKQIDQHGAVDKIFPDLASLAGGAAPPPEASPAAPSTPAPSSPVPPAPPGVLEKRLTGAKPVPPAKQVVPGGGGILQGILDRAR
jgi:hypothetical protein